MADGAPAASAVSDVGATPGRVTSSPPQVADAMASVLAAASDKAREMEIRIGVV
jgi:hypothetical protein